MNLMALVAGLLPWADTPLSAFIRFYLACSILSIEVQLVTWLGRGTLDTLLPVNVGLALVAVILQQRAGRSAWGWAAATWRALPAPAVLALVLVVGTLNLVRPAQAADPYELDRMLRIASTGTLAYAPDIDPKANIVAAFYELMLADLASTPLLGPWLLKLHGLVGLFVLCLAVAATRTWLPPGRSAWAAALPLVVPVILHQMVLIKSDLFIGVAALVALAWSVGQVQRFTWRDGLCAGWLAGLAVAAKLTNSAVAIALALALRMRERNWRFIPPVTAGALAGVAAGGLLLMLWQNARVYGDPFASAQVEAIGNVNRTIGAAAVSLVRLLVSLVDMSLLTRQIWPGRGGWGGPFGLPLLWALIVLVSCCRTSATARRALLAGMLPLLALGVTFPDADISHRLAFGPGMLLVVAGASMPVATEHQWSARSLVAVVILSSLQILRSAALYFTGSNIS